MPSENTLDALSQRVRQLSDEVTFFMDALRQLSSDVDAEGQPHNKQTVVKLLTASIEHLGLARNTLGQAADMIDMPPPVVS